jgi:cysteine-rich repeat protein
LPISGGTVNFALNVTTNFLGPILGNTPSFFGGVVDVNASSNVFGVLDTDTPFDFFNNLDAFLMPEEPDCSVDIEKEVREIKDPLDEWADADQCTDNDVPMISVPGGAMYRLIVTNTGINTLLANCVITDNQLGISQEIMPPPLVPGETVTLTGMDIPALFVTDRCEVAGELLNTADIICDCFDGEVDLGIDATDADDACINCVEEPICGDGIVGNTPGETCDPPTGFCTGFDIPRTACASDTDCPTGETCGGLVAPVDGGAADRTCRDSGGPDECTYCGDGIENNAEECDDGNDIDDDSCSNTCITNQPDIDIEKTTDGAPNGNPVDSDFDNEDSANGPGIPVLNTR